MQLCSAVRAAYIYARKYVFQYCDMAYAMKQTRLA